MKTLVISLGFSHLFVHGVENCQYVAQSLSKLVGICPKLNLAHSWCLIKYLLITLWKLNGPSGHSALKYPENAFENFSHSRSCRNPPLCRFSYQMDMNVKQQFGSILKNFWKNKWGILFHSFNIYLPLGLYQASWLLSSFRQPSYIWRICFLKPWLSLVETRDPYLSQSWRSKIRGAHERWWCKGKPRRLNQEECPSSWRWWSNAETQQHWQCPCQAGIWGVSAQWHKQSIIIIINTYT